MLEFDDGRGSEVPARLRQQIFRGSDAVAEGLISASRLRREYPRVLHGIYAPPGFRVDHGVRTIGALLGLPVNAVLTAHSSAWWYGVEYADATDPVMVILPTDGAVKGPRGVRVHNTCLAADDIEIVDGLRLASPLRTAWDAATLTSPQSALSTVDGLLRRSILAPDQLRELVVSMPGRWGVCRARPIFELADGLSESPGESWTRWILYRCGFPPPVKQFEVLDEMGRFVARVDFSWPDRRLALEYDGAYHAQPHQHTRDQTRDDALVALGWTVIHMTSRDLHDPTRVQQELRVRLA